MQRTSGAALDRLFRPRSVAVVGASADVGKLTGRPIAYLRRHGFTGRIFPINPRYQEIAGLTCYPDAGALPEPPDVGLVLLGADQVADAVRQLAKAGTAAAVVLASGFGEAGPEGERRQQQLKDAAGAMRLLGPNTIGLVNVTDHVMLSASGAMKGLDEFPVGHIGLVSQSGGILGSLLSRAAARGIGFSKLVATGNEVNLDVSDCVDYLLDDPATSVIALYLEGLRTSGRFRTAAARAAQLGKPIVAFKVGRSEAGVRSAVSHTGALAGADRMYDALFRQLGVRRAQTFADLLDVPATLAQRRLLRGRRIAIVTSTGGAATLVADCAGLAGFDLPPPDAATAGALAKLNIRDAVLDRNPIDLTLGGLRPDILRTVIEVMLASRSYDAIVVIIGSSAIGQPELVAQPLIAALPTSDKPVLAYVSPEAPQIVRHLNRAGVPAFSTPEGCAAALAALVPPAPPSLQSKLDHRATPGPVALADLPPAGPLNEAESKRLFARFGIASANEIVAATPAEAEPAAQRIGGKVVLKILSRHIAHKSELGGVVVGVEPQDAAQRCTEMAARVGSRAPHPIEGFLVQEMIDEGTELILGFHRDPQLGAAVLLGLGGVTAELFGDAVLRMAPVTRQDAEAMISELKSAPLLRGFRGRAPGDVDALATAIVAFSDMIVALGARVAEAEINPLFVLPAGRGVRAADGLVVLRPDEGVT